MAWYDPQNQWGSTNVGSGWGGYSAHGSQYAPQQSYATGYGPQQQQGYGYTQPYSGYEPQYQQQQQPYYDYSTPYSGYGYQQPSGSPYGAHGGGGYGYGAQTVSTPAPSNFSFNMNPYHGQTPTPTIPQPKGVEQIAQGLVNKGFDVVGGWAASGLKSIGIPVPEKTIKKVLGGIGKAVSSGVGKVAGAVASFFGF